VTEEDRKERDRRLDMVRKYVPAYRSYYGGFWWYLTSPQILEFAVGKDGYYIDVQSLAGTGKYYFTPWGGEPEFLGEWIS
jgi:hypothetical protein